MEEASGHRRRMRYFAILFLLLGLNGATAAWAQEPGLKVSKAEVRKDVLAVIEGQLAAFRAEDVPKAYGFASRALRRQAALPVFSQMVQFGYPEIWANTRAEFGLVRDDGVRATTTARIYAKDGKSATYDYVLVSEEKGWRIAGVLRHEPRGEKT